MNIEEEYYNINERLITIIELTKAIHESDIDVLDKQKVFDDMWEYTKEMIEQLEYWV